VVGAWLSCDICIFKKQHTSSHIGITRQRKRSYLQQNIFTSMYGNKASTQSSISLSHETPKQMIREEVQSNSDNVIPWHDSHKQKNVDASKPAISLSQHASVSPYRSYQLMTSSTVFSLSLSAVVAALLS
jgi:hypothetical protein